MKYGKDGGTGRSGKKERRKGIEREKSVFTLMYPSQAKPAMVVSRKSLKEEKNRRHLVSFKQSRLTHCGPLKRALHFRAS